ncbi:2338_t:CDS:1 [Gigaspora margarita]|uniref:2338_t:CDS:1 n=1 Tax=Gigaspora margarita TaxID=4874 RepID=A0ABN7U943_GIGMA|nr:2338_t:CDS:1 [Gigaspora margarita]
MSPISTSYDPNTRTKPSTLQVMQTDVVHDIQSSQLTQVRVNTNYHASNRFASPTNDHTLPARETVTPGVSGSSGVVRWGNLPEYVGYRRTILASWAIISFFYLFAFV